MSSSDTRAETHVFTPLQRGLGKPRTNAANKPACRQSRQSRLRNARSAFVSRRNAALLLRYTLRLFLLCCALYALYTEGRISLEEALHNADSRTDLALRVRLAAGVSTSDAGELSIDTSTPLQSASRLS